MDELLKEQAWNKSYNRKENYVFYPDNQIIRFISHYIKKQTSIDDFTVNRPYTKALDLCCGIGRHMNVLDNYGFDVEGIELSSSAVVFAQKWFESLNKSHLIPHIRTGSATELPYADESFDFVISCSALDSMYFSIAETVVKEVHRVLKPNGLFFFDVIASDTRNQQANDMLVDDIHEQGTIQSYYNDERIQQLKQDQFDLLEHFIVCTEYKISPSITSRNYVTFQKI